MYLTEENIIRAYTASSEERIVLPDKIQNIGSHAFSGHGELRRVSLSDGIKTIGESAFRDCVNLEEIVFGAELKRLNADCFRGCSALRSVTLPDTVASIRSGAFSGCHSLKTIDLSAGLRRRIESETFAGCRALKRIVIPAQVEQIEFKAFCDCTQLETVIFENPDIRIERGAFVGCPSLDEATVRFIQAHTFSHVVLDIRSASRGAVGRLSNFTARAFVFDGVACGSIEGVLQSFKCADPVRQREICALAGNEARMAGMAYDWRERQELYWLGTAYPRVSDAYQQLLDRLYDAAYAQDASLRDDLEQVRGRELSHRLGRTDPTQTILTRQELLDRLDRLRARTASCG
ncbi:MAG: leucine-rich repeat protein [Clostridia bacterium]|nr:leucine-rich repeat protein [Clostridia bacterium]